MVRVTLKESYCTIENMINRFVTVILFIIIRCNSFYINTNVNHQVHCLNKLFVYNNKFNDNSNNNNNNNNKQNDKSKTRYNPFDKTSRPSQNNKVKPFTDKSNSLLNNNRINKNNSNENYKSDELIENLLESVKITDEERLQKVLARAGIASRRESEKVILDGRVVVNGVIVTELGTKVNARKDIIIVDGKRITLPDSKETYWIVLHKPRDTISTISDSSNRNTISSLIPKAQELRLIPVRGLDRDATGLILLTNDIGWIHPLTHPSFRHKNRYNIVVKGLITDLSLESIRLGLQLPETDVKLQPAIVSILDVDRPNNLTLLDITIEEAISNQLDLMVKAINCELISVKRTEFGPIRLKGLKRGMWKELSLTEIEQLKDSCKNAVKKYDIVVKRAN